jgi:RND superfamily putative drug exporter
LARRDNAAAVNIGQAITGRTITAAAAIMTVVFTSFIFTTDRTIKMIGLGMATAIVVDALIVRTILVPAVMQSLGKANWYFPRWMDQRLPHLDLEERSAPATADPTIGSLRMRDQGEEREGEAAGLTVRQ